MRWSSPCIIKKYDKSFKILLHKPGRIIHYNASTIVSLYSKLLNLVKQTVRSKPQIGEQTHNTTPVT